MEIDPGTAEGMYRTMTGLIVPRPIGWISTRSTDGEDNLAPYSFFGALNEESPPVLMYSAENWEDGSTKDSVVNALETEAFVHNLVTMDLLDAMDRTLEDADRSEFDVAGLTAQSAATVDAPRVAQAKAHMECSLYNSVRLGDHTLVLGEVEQIHVDDDLLDEDGKVDVRKVDAVGRLTGRYYARLEIVEVDREW
jgi:flavin reductase (DIM6/NTAB) family NADH-FMN oxidoreductase RutF